MKEKVNNIQEQVHIAIENPTVALAEHYVKSVGMGCVLGCTLVGPAGMGKTHLIENVLKDMGVEYVKYGGHITLAAIYEFLFENHNNLIFFDDCSNIIQQTEIMELLKQALLENQIKRELHYRSYGVKTGAPNKFVFDGRIIMAFNVMDKNNPNVMAVRSRAPYVELRYSYAEIMEAMKQISAGAGGGLLEHEKVIITREIETYTDASMDVSLRDQQQAFNLYRSCKTLYGEGNDKWKSLVHNLFGRKKESWIREMVKKLCGEGKIPRKELAKHIAIVMNQSPRNAQRKIAEWLESDEIFQNKARDGDISIKPFV